MLRRKLRSKRGFTLSELLVTMAVMALVGVAVAAGISSAGKALNTITASSEASVLSSTLALELSDELRFAGNISGGADGITFDSTRFGKGVKVESSDGRVTVGGMPILGEKAYTGLRADAQVSYSGGSFHVTITIFSAGSPSVELLSSRFSVSPLSG